MFYHLQYIHLFRPFLKYTPASSPLPSHVSPRRICTANAGAISKLMRLYKKTYNLRQICNIAVYMVHSACTIHMLNLPEKTAKRDIIHGVRHLEEIAEDWPCARRTLCIISVLARKWGVELPEDAATVLQRTDEKYGSFNTSDVPSPNRSAASMIATPSPPSYPGSPPLPPQQKQEQFSPLGQYSQPTPPQMPLDNIRISPEIMNGLAQQQQQQQQQQMAHNIVASAPPMSMSDAMSVASSWAAMPAVTTQSMGGYGQQAFSPAIATTGMGARHHASSPSSSAVYAIDGEDWYLKDGVSWQQNFQAWSMGGGQNEANRAGGSGMASPSSMFMFQGMRSNGGGDLDGGGFDAFGSIGTLDHLPGLD